MKIRLQLFTLFFTLYATICKDLQGNETPVISVGVFSCQFSISAIFVNLGYSQLIASLVIFGFSYEISVKFTSSLNPYILYALQFDTFPYLGYFNFTVQRYFMRNYTLQRERTRNPNSRISTRRDRTN